MNKIPCIVLSFFNKDIIETTLNCLLKEKDRLDIYVVENKSTQTPEISEMCKAMVENRVNKKVYSLRRKYF